MAAYMRILALVLSLAASPAFATPGDILLVRDHAVSLRKSPRPNGAVVMQLEPGRKLLEFERREAWVRVVVFETLGSEGWVPVGAVVRQPRPKYKPPQTSRPGSVAVLGADNGYVLEISGSPGIRYRSDCRLVTDDTKTRRLVRRGLIPDRFRVEVAAVSCTVQKFDVGGRLKVTLLADGRVRGSAETAAAFNWVRVRSDGPWGEAQSVRGDLRFLREATHPAPSKREVRQIVPPFQPGLIPNFR